MCLADPDVQGQKTVEMRTVQQLLGAADKLGQAETAMRLLCSVPPTAAASLLAFSQPDGLQVWDQPASYLRRGTARGAMARQLTFQPDGLGRSLEVLCTLRSDQSL